MYCEHCGMMIGDPGTPCPGCGQLQSSSLTDFDQTPDREFPAEPEGETSSQEEPVPVDTRPAKAVLLLAIVGLILGGTVYLSLAGVILSAIALYRSAALLGTPAGETAAAKRGRVLAWIGLIVGAVLILGTMIFLVIVSRYAVR